MKRYENDYGMARHSARRPLGRAEAAKVIAAPLPKRTTGHARANAGHAIRWEAWLPVWTWIVVMVLWAMAWVIAFAS